MWHSTWVGVRALIDARPAIVWSILADGDQYAVWNPFLIDIEQRADRLIGLTIAAPDGRIERLRGHFSERHSERSLRWTQVPRFLSSQRREYLVQLEADGQRTRLRHGFALSGWARRADCLHTIRQTRLGLRLMTETLQRVAEAGSIAAWLNPAYPRTTGDYRWMPVHQARVYHQVVKAIEIIRRSPRRIEMMSLSGWSRGCRQGRSYLTCDGAISVGFRPEKLPTTLDGLHPIIVGVLHARTFVLDGAHRIAAHLQAGKTTIPAVRLTAAETVACIRDGFQTKVRFESADLVPPGDFPLTKPTSASLVA